MSRPTRSRARPLLAFAKVMDALFHRAGACADHNDTAITTEVLLQQPVVLVFVVPVVASW